MPRVITFELCLQLNHLNILLQKVPHNNNRVTEKRDILKQRSTLNVYSTSPGGGGARMCPAQFEMSLIASVAAVRLCLVLVDGVSSTFYCSEGSFKGVDVTSSGYSFVMGRLVYTLLVRM